MIIFNQFTPKPQATKEEMTEMMAKFAEVGTGEGTVLGHYIKTDGSGEGTVLGHYIKTDGSGAFNIVEVDDMNSVYRTTLEYLPFMEIESTPVIDIENGVAQIMDYLS